MLTYAAGAAGAAGGPQYRHAATLGTSTRLRSDTCAGEAVGWDRTVGCEHAHLLCDIRVMQALNRLLVSLLLMLGAHAASLPAQVLSLLALLVQKDRY